MPETVATMPSLSLECFEPPAGCGFTRAGAAGPAGGGAAHGGGSMPLGAWSLMTGTPSTSWRKQRCPDEGGGASCHGNPVHLANRCESRLQSEIVIFRRGDQMVAGAGVLALM